MTYDDNAADPHGAAPKPTEHDALSAAEREELIAARRMRQQGGKSSGRKVVASMAVMGVGLVILVVFIGPSSLRSLFGGGSQGQRTSQVDMEVDRDRSQNVQLDFVVPAKAVPEEKKAVDPTLALNEKLRDLQAQLAEVTRKKQTGASNAEIQQMLARYSETMTQKMEEQRRALTAENERLKAEAARAEEQRRLLEETSKTAAAQLKERQALEKAQRESDAVVVDEAGGTMVGSFAPDGSAAGTDDLNANERFLKASASSVFETSVSTKLADPSRTVVQGTIVSAVLETAIDTQLPGNLRAQVMEPVFAFDGSRVLMPQGTILIGTFNNDVDLAQKRVLIAWNRAITPDGKSVTLGSSGTDRLGRAGTEGNVDNRYLTKFGTAALISAITIAPSMISQNVSGGGQSGRGGTTVNVGSSGGGQNIAGSLGGSLSDQSSGVLQKYLDLPPVIRVPQGEEIRIFVNRDLVFR